MQGETGETSVLYFIIVGNVSTCTYNWEISTCVCRKHHLSPKQRERKSKFNTKLNSLKSML